MPRASLIALRFISARGYQRACFLWMQPPTAPHKFTSALCDGLTVHVLVKLRLACSTPRMGFGKRGFVGELKIGFQTCCYLRGYLIPLHSHIATNMRILYIATSINTILLRTDPTTVLGLLSGDGLAIRRPQPVLTTDLGPAQAQCLIARMQRLLFTCSSCR